MADRLPDTVGAGEPRKSVTIYDIALAAGVSHQSVSRYVRGLDMRSSTKEKIRAALETLDYKPNLSARALITGRSMRIGALTHEAHQIGPAMVIRGATIAARRAGYLLDVVSLDMGDAAEINDALQSLMQFDLAGILAFASSDTTREVFESTAFSVPAIIASETDEPEQSAASRAATRGIRAVVDHLVTFGHRRFFHVAGPNDWAAARNRSRAFSDAVTEHGLTITGIQHGDWSARSGFDLVRALDVMPLPTAIVAANDQMALGAMHALHERGLRVPDDVSVTGLDDTPEAPFYTPPLTTVRLDFGQEGRDAVNGLLDIINPSGAHTRGPESPSPSITSGSLITRRSSGPAAS